MLGHTSFRRRAGGECLARLPGCVGMSFFSSRPHTRSPAHTCCQGCQVSSRPLEYRRAQGWESGPALESQDVGRWGGGPEHSPGQRLHGCVGNREEEEVVAGPPSSTRDWARSGAGPEGGPPRSQSQRATSKPAPWTWWSPADMWAHSRAGGVDPAMKGSPEGDSWARGHISLVPCRWEGQAVLCEGSLAGALPGR